LGGYLGLPTWRYIVAFGSPQSSRAAISRDGFHSHTIRWRTRMV
jgi:hypothetical protein